MRKSLLKVFFFIACYFLMPCSGTAQSTEQIDSMELENFIHEISYGDSSRGANGKKVNDIINFAKKFVGTPYHYGGTTPAGFDCSGFIFYITGNFGMSLTRTSYGLAEFGKTVKLSELRPGDLMFFKGRNVNSTNVGHVSMVVEVGPGVIKFIHASTSRGVVIDNFTTSKYYIPRFIKAKRLDYGDEEIEDLMIDESMKEER
jgi:hypothetical protein